MLAMYVHRLSYTRSHVGLDVPVHQALGIAHFGRTYKTCEAHIQSHHYFQHKLSSYFSYESISLCTDVLIRKPVPYPKLPTRLEHEVVREVEFRVNALEQHQVSVDPFTDGEVFDIHMHQK